MIKSSWDRNVEEKLQRDWGVSILLQGDIMIVGTQTVSQVMLLLLYISLC